MNIIVSFTGRFHYFDLVKQIQKRSYLKKFITTYPKFITKRWQIKSKNVVSFFSLEILNRLNNKIKSQIISNIFFRIHSILTLRYLNSDCDILIGGGLDAIIEARKQGIVTIVERGSSHYSYQQKLLEKEYKKYGLDFKIQYDYWARDLLSYDLCDYISVPSSFVKRSFLEYGISEKKILVNPYGVDLSQFKQIKKEDDIFRVIFCGTLSIQKGSHYLLQAFYELNMSDIELWHIGNISNEMKPFIKKYTSSNIVYKGSYPQRELFKLYSQGNVFCIPSLQEGMAMVQLQAMACGLPLICTTNTGGEDLITKDGEEGFVIPIRSIDDIKNKINYLYENQDIAYQMGQKAKIKVSNGFTWDDYGDRYIKNLEIIKKNIKDIK